MMVQSSTRMTKDMCQSAADMINPSNVSHLSLIGMCCVFRAAVVLSDEESLGLPNLDVPALLPALHLFAQRWAIGGSIPYF